MENKLFDLSMDDKLFDLSMDDKLFDCCLKIETSDSKTFSHYTYRHTLTKYSYFTTLFKMSEPDSIICEKPNFYVCYNICIPFQKDVVLCLLSEDDSLKDLDKTSLVCACNFFGLKISEIRKMIINFIDEMEKNPKEFLDFLIQMLKNCFNQLIIDNLISRYYSIFNLEQKKIIENLFQEEIIFPEVYDISHHGTFENQVLCLYSSECSSLSGFVFNNFKFRVYCTSVFIDAEMTYGFFITCCNKADNDNPSYEECQKANLLPRQQVLIELCVFDFQLQKPMKRSLQIRRNKILTLPCEYKYTTLSRYGEILYEDLCDPVCFMKITFL